MPQKRGKNKEKFREMRRQGDPAFPSKGSQQGSRIPRPNALTTNRQKSPENEPILSSEQQKQPEKEPIRSSEQQKQPEKDPIISSEQQKQPEKEPILSSEQQKQPEKEPILSSDQQKPPEKPSILSSNHSNSPEKDPIPSPDCHTLSEIDCSLSIDDPKVSKLTNKNDPVEEPEKTINSKPSKKGTKKVSFDLSKNGTKEVDVVAECWEDLSDDNAYEFNDDELIDCEKEIGDLGEDFLGFGHGILPQETSGRFPTGNFYVGPTCNPVVNNIEDFGAIGNDEDGSDYDNVEESKSHSDDIEQNIRYFSDDNSDDIKVAEMYKGSRGRPNVVDVTARNEAVIVEEATNLPMKQDKKSKASKIPCIISSSKKNIFDTENFPYIDGSDDSVQNLLNAGAEASLPVPIASSGTTADNDSEWETEQSGGSDDSGNIYKFNIDYTKTPPVQPVNKIYKANSLGLYDDKAKVVGQPTICEEDDSYIITNEDMDAAFQSAMQEEEDPIPNSMKKEKVILEKDQVDDQSPLSKDDSDLTWVGLAEKNPELTWVPVSEETPDIPWLNLSDKEQKTEACVQSEKKPELKDEGFFENNDGVKTSDATEKIGFSLQMNKSSINEKLENSSMLDKKSHSSDMKSEELQNVIKPEESHDILLGPPIDKTNEIQRYAKDSLPNQSDEGSQLVADYTKSKQDQLVIASSKDIIEQSKDDLGNIAQNCEEPSDIKSNSDTKENIHENQIKERDSHQYKPDGTHEDLVLEQVSNIIQGTLDAPKKSSSPHSEEVPNIFVGPLPKTELPVSQSNLITVNNSFRSLSPNVSIGFECREGKPRTSCTSETESEGELVIGEDKCVGTSDDGIFCEDELKDAVFSDETPTDLSVHEVTSSQEYDISESKETVSFRSEDESPIESLKEDSYDDRFTNNFDKDNLEIPPNDRIPDSPSPEIPVSKPLGSSESIKEKEKKNVKKKGKKRREDKVEKLTKMEPPPDRRILVRGKSWKEKMDQLKTTHIEPLSLSFGNEICEPEIVEGTSNLLTETYTEASLHTASKCSTETTIVTETPCTACSSLTGEFQDSESCKDCLRGEKRYVGSDVQVTEIKPSEDDLVLTPTVTQPSNVNINVTFVCEKSDQEHQLPQHAADKDDFYIVKACEVAVPLEVLKEYVPDSESSDNSKGSGNDNKLELNKDSKDSHGRVDSVSKSKGLELSVDISNNASSTYFDAKDSSCTDKIMGSYDYVESFPSIIGTQNVSYVYSYEDDKAFEKQTDRPKLTVKPLNATLESSGVMVVNVGEDSDNDSNTTPLAMGDIVYEGPCLCGPKERTKNVGKGNEKEGSEDDAFCVPPLFSSNQECPLVDNTGMVVETHGSMESNSEDSLGFNETNSKDIRSRIEQIVGPRINQPRGRQSVRQQGGIIINSTSNSFLTTGDYDQARDSRNLEGRDESPMPNSSPASSSGVQGSDEMSPSRSRSPSPSLSPASTNDNIPDIAYEPYQVQEVVISGETEHDFAGNFKFENDTDSIPEKKTSVDYSFKSFRDMYQINPVYMTDSDDHEDRNESDTLQNSSGLSYDPERSITVNSWGGSGSEESPAPKEPSTSPSPLVAPVVRGTKKVPKVTKQLRETQGIVQRWEVLQAQAVERQRQSGQVRELQRQVKQMRLTLENLAEQASRSSQTDAIGNRHQLSHKLQESKDLLDEVRARKAEVASLNLAVHRFFTDSGYSLTQLKDEVSDLYILYDEAHRRASNEVSRLEGLDVTWKLYETEVDELTRALRQDEETLKVLDVAIQTGSLTDSATASMQDVAKLLNDKRKSQQTGKKLTLQHTRTQGVDIQGSTLSLITTGDDCLSDSGTSGYESCSSEDLSERERRLAHLRRLARDLESSLNPDSEAWQNITKTLACAENELKGLQKHCRDLVVKSTETLDQTKTTTPQFRRRSWVKDSKTGRMSRIERRSTSTSRDSGRGNGKRGWIWRVVRAALPFQAALLLLFCVACLLEPNCCDTHNSLTMTLTPQLRYVHGPPPV